MLLKEGVKAERAGFEVMVEHLLFSETACSLITSTLLPRDVSSCRSPITCACGDKNGMGREGSSAPGKTNYD